MLVPHAKALTVMNLFQRVKVRPTIPLDMDPKVNKELYEEADEEGVRFLLKSGVTNTSMHGLPRVFKASSPNRRIFWLIVLLVGLGESK